jgi:DHA1 family multidrug resistance protein-like MFS transporter
MGGVIPSISALLTRYSNEGSEGAVFGLDNSVRAGARAIAPLIGAAIALAFGLRVTFLATGLIFMFGALLAGLRLPAPADQPAMDSLHDSPAGVLSEASQEGDSVRESA